MAEIELIAGNWGFQFDFLISDNSTAVDISAATVKKLYFQRPDSSTFEFAASFKTTGTDGYLRWTPTEGQIRRKDQGNWRVRAYLEGVPSFNGWSRWASFYAQD